MTSPSAAHTGIVSVATSADFAAAAEAMATRLVDAGHASWCPTCGGTGETQVGVHSIARPDVGPDARGLAPTLGTCARCRGGRLNPFHGCTFTTDDPCACTTRCQAYQPQETPMPTENPTCSTCDRPATARVAGANPSKGDLVCDSCKPMWPFATFVPLDGAR